MITFHNAFNIGANLQAYALNKYINENIGDCEIIDFIPNNRVVQQSKFKKCLHLIKAAISFPLKGKEKKFKIFQKKYKISNRQFNGDNDIFANPPRYDILISGSDQALNATLSGNSKSFYLGFYDNCKKISYASSFGRKEISDVETNLIKSQLIKFSAISVREQSGADIIKEIIGKDAQLVLDPVFLLSADEWRTLSTKSKLPDKYIFVYLMECSYEMLNVIEQVRQEYKLPIIVAYGVCGAIDNVIEAKNCGPKDFIYYLDNAELVVTNSFHGTAFSIILEKDFICVAHSKRNERLANIMDLCKEADKLILKQPKSDIKNNVVLGANANKYISEHIKRSKDYLNINCKLNEGE